MNHHTSKRVVHQRMTRTWGMCLHCGSIEVELNNVTGYRDYSHIGESSSYPVGYGCELCA